MSDKYLPHSQISLFGHFLAPPRPVNFGVSQMLTIDDGGRRGVQEPLVLADVICEQPLIACHFCSLIAKKKKPHIT